VLAGYHMMIPFIMPELPAEQKTALRAAVKAPIIYTKVALDNWHAFDALKAHSIHAPTQRYTQMQLERPAGKTPDDPVVLHMTYVPMVPDSGMPVRDRFRAGRAQLLATPYQALERDVLGQLDRILGATGFSAQRDVQAITVNRWSHGYACMPSSLEEDLETSRRRLAAAAAPMGRSTIANSDAAGSPSVGAAISQAFRAVDTLA
jgi:spermidine dehydrogenase